TKLQALDAVIADPDLYSDARRAERQKVMAEHGLSFSAHVRQCRLEQCRLAIETQSGRSIADIAASWGFEEVSTFNRAYRAQYGRSPGSERAGTSSRDGRRI
ncbi:MAG: AraC family transcriptional regulator, partial [Achromobacter sp.]|nr:AraC family transcriptional regulator [Achromobacter sp.]